MSLRVDVSSGVLSGGVLPPAGRPVYCWLVPPLQLCPIFGCWDLAPNMQTCVSARDSWVVGLCAVGQTLRDEVERQVEKSCSSTCPWQYSEL